MHEGATLKNCVIRSKSSTAYAVVADGDNITLENVNIESSTGYHLYGNGFYRGIQMQNSNDSTITNCLSQGNLQFGINIESSDNVTVTNCEGYYNGLDGAKLLAHATNIHFVGGTYRLNGTDPINAGDGLDIFAGGNTVDIVGGIYSDNQGNGITAKTDTLTRDEPEIYGIPGNISVTNVTANNNTGSGLTAYAFGDETIPLFVGASFLNCTCQNNLQYGLYINADDVTATNVTVNNSGINGVRIDVRSIDVTLTNVTGDDIVDLR